MSSVICDACPLPLSSEDSLRDHASAEGSSAAFETPLFMSREAS